MGELRIDECVGSKCLLLSDFGKMSVCPGYCAVSFQFGPVVVPGFGSIECFSYIVVTLAVAAHVEEFVGCVLWAFRDEMLDVSSETLPGWIFGRFWGVCWVVSLNQAEIVCLCGVSCFVEEDIGWRSYKVEAPPVGLRIILQENPRVDLISEVMLFCGAHIGML